MRHAIGTRLRHHGGSVWEVVGYVPGRDYRVRCVVGTVREGWIGGEVEGTVREFHPDYLHGDGWRIESADGAMRAVQGKDGCHDVRCRRMIGPGGFDWDRCLGWHCATCGEPTSSQGHDCPQAALGTTRKSEEER